MKKNIVFTIICILTVTTIEAQHFISGSFSYSSTSGEESYSNDTQDLPSSKSFELLPRYGYQFNDKWAFGIGIGYLTQKNTENRYGYNSTDTYTDKNSMIVLAPFVRFTFAKLNKFSFMAEAEAEVGYGTGDSEVIKNGSLNSTHDLTLTTISVTPVIKYDINDKWAIESTVKLFGISYSSYKQSVNNYEATNNSFDFGAGTDLGAISLGAIYKF